MKTYVLSSLCNESNLSLQQKQPHSNADVWTKNKGHVRSLGFFFRYKLLCCTVLYPDSLFYCSYVQELDASREAMQTALTCQDQILI